MIIAHSPKTILKVVAFSVSILATTPYGARAGFCQQDSECNDFDPCTQDTCDSMLGCMNTPFNVSCTPGPAGDALCQSAVIPTSCCDDVSETCTCIAPSNPVNHLAARLVNCSAENPTGFSCFVDNSDCTGANPDWQCSDDDAVLFNGGICVDQCCYEATDTVDVDIHLGALFSCDNSISVACGTELYLEWDTDTLELVSMTPDPGGFLGWSQENFNTVDTVAGRIDLGFGLPDGTPCNAVAGSFGNTEIVRLTFNPLIPLGPSGGVQFRSDSTSVLIGPSGSFTLGGLHGDASPSPTGEIVIASDCANPPAIPASSTWGLMVMGAGLAVAAAVIIRRRRLQVT
jgi:hypothetical protein